MIPKNNTTRRRNILPAKEFAKRMLRYFLISTLLVVISLAIGILGYHHFGQLSWIDSFYNASMILTGMGPVNQMSSEAGKIFASFYALYSGVTFLSTVAVFFSPIAHRLLHVLHVEDENEEE